jgi:molecular chaperone GrpE (heat shock protein)
MPTTSKDQEALAELSNGDLRLAGDFENTQRRIREETDPIGIRQKSFLVKDVLSVLDNLNRARLNLPRMTPYCFVLELR